MRDPGLAFSKIQFLQMSPDYYLSTVMRGESKFREQSLHVPLDRVVFLEAVSKIGCVSLLQEFAAFFLVWVEKVQKRDYFIGSTSYEESFFFENWAI